MIGYRNTLLKLNSLRGVSSAASLKCLNTGTYEIEYRKSIDEPYKYWDERKNLIKWFREPKIILNKSNSPFEKWYILGR